MEMVAWSSVPDFDGYKKALAAAKQTAGTAADGHMRAADESIVKRIERCIEDSRVRVMWCFDNGLGLDWQRMFRLLEEGAGSKGADTESRGSFGLGHFQPFGASDLRYVLYGGRAKGSDGLLCSGQAILAVHQHGDEPFRSGTGVLATKLDTSNIMFERNHEYGRVPLVKSRLADWLDTNGQDTGTAVGVLGFNMFAHSNEDSFIDAVFDAAAKHFSVALLKSGVEISITTEDDKRRELSASNRRLIDRRREVWEQDVNRSKARGRLLPGLYARRTYDTLSTGEQSEAANCDVWVRRLSERGQPSKVNVFRDGMWITYEAPGLETKQFNDTKAFDAIVNITSRAKMYRLAKTAEPSSHLEIDPRRLDRQQRHAYDRCIDEIAVKLREMAGELTSDQEYEDPSFAPVEGIEARMKRTKPLNPHPPPSPTPEPDPEPDPGPGPEPGPPGPPGPDPPPPPPPVPGPNPDRPTPSGKPAGHVVSAVSRDGAKISAVTTLRPDSELVAVTLIRHSGSDRSCDRYVHPTSIPIKSVVTNDGRVYDPAPGTDLEVILPAALLRDGPFDVNPVDAIFEDHGVEVVLRRRRNEQVP